MKPIIALCFVILSNALGQNLRPQSFTKDGRVENDLNHENLLRQIQQWQQGLLQPGIQQQAGEQFFVQPNSNLQQQQVLNKYNYDGQYNNNPWIQPTPAPQPPQSGYYPNQPNNPYQPQPQPQPQPNPIPPANSGYFPVTSPPYQPVTQTPAPAPTHPPASPEVEALRKYCLSPRGQYPSNKCNTYINCWDDVIVEQDCPTGLVFSTQGFCDYPYNVDCGSRQVPGVTPAPTIEGNQKCPKPSGTYRSASNCSEFFVCVNGLPVKFSCPAELYYNTVLGVCDYPYNVNCINPRPLEPLVPQPQPQPELPPPQPIYNPYYLQRVPAGVFNNNNEQSCIPNSVFRLVPDCSSVAVCRAGKTEVITCGQHTAYDAERGECLARHLVRC